MTVKLALYKGRGGIANAVIRWWTGSIYSHCELVVDGLCYSSSVMDKGVRRKQIDLADGKIWLSCRGLTETRSSNTSKRLTTTSTAGWG
jgi:hypothetical protein